MASGTKKRKKRRKFITNKFYIYKKSGIYLREKLGDDSGCVDYRIKKIKSGRELLICIKSKPGPRGGKTKAISLLRNAKTLKPSYYKKKKEIDVARALEKAKKILKERKKK